MSTLNDSEVRALLDQPNFAVISTMNDDGSVLDTVVWFDVEDGTVNVNSAVGRRWPTNLQRDPRVTLLVMENGNPMKYVEIRGTATATREDADDHTNRLTKRYMNLDEYPFRQPGEERIKFIIRPDHVRYVDMAG